MYNFIIVTVVLHAVCNGCIYIGIFINQISTCSQPCHAASSCPPELLSTEAEVYDLIVDLHGSLQVHGMSAKMAFLQKCWEELLMQLYQVSLDYLIYI